MTVRDIDSVLVIERACFTAPWSRSAFVGELTENHFAHYYLLMKGDQMVGYGGMWVIIDEAHVTNIAVLPNFRRHQLGERLLRQLIVDALALGAHKMTLEVRVGNQPALGLYRKLGFQDGGIRRSYYTDNHEDALVMWIDLPSLQEVADATQ